MNDTPEVAANENQQEYNNRRQVHLRSWKYCKGESFTKAMGGFIDRRHCFTSHVTYISHRKDEDF